MDKTRIKYRILSAISPDSLAEVKSNWEKLGIDFWLSDKDGVIELSKIILPKSERGKGVGTKAMQLLTDYADKVGNTIVLTPSSDFGGSKVRLINFYKSFGFVDNKGRNKKYEIRETMYRRPESK